jgi:hypothetical protein
MDPAARCNIQPMNLRLDTPATGVCEVKFIGSEPKASEESYQGSLTAFLVNAFWKILHYASPRSG